MPIISLDIVNVDESQTKNLITHSQFDNYIDLKFKITKKSKEEYKIHTIHVPPKNSSILDFDNSIIVFRINMINMGNLFVTLGDSTYDIRVSYLYKIQIHYILYF